MGMVIKPTVVIIFVLIQSFLQIQRITANEVGDVDKCAPEEGHKSIADMLESYGLKTGVELGVQHGNFAEKMLTVWKSCEKYYLVDIWQMQENYKDGANVDNESQQGNYQRTKERMQQFGDRAVLIRNWTKAAALLFEDESLDFVYVDARHDYCGALNDIETWYPKIKPGGIMAGHDYVENVDWGKCEDGTDMPGGVKGAVEKFSTDHKIKVKITNDQWACWIFNRKPKHL